MTAISSKLGGIAFLVLVLSAPPVCAAGRCHVLRAGVRTVP
jgi:hypothetical protein